MNNESAPEYIIDIKCPFCDEVIITTSDLSEIDEVNEDIIKTMDYWYNPNGTCEHFAFFGEGYNLDPEVKENWQNEMSLFASEHEVDNTLNLSADKLARQIWNILWQENSGTIDAIFKKSLPFLNFSVVEKDVDWDCGPMGASGPHYRLIFLKKHI